MSLADSFRSRAKQQRDLANELITTQPLIRQDADGKFDAQNLVTAIVGHLNATILETNADAMDYLRVTTGEDSLISRRKRIMERNDAIRTAAARGDWEEFDRLAAGDDPAGSVEGGNAT